MTLRHQYKDSYLMEIILTLIALFIIVGVVLDRIKQLFDKTMSHSPIDFFITALAVGLICIFAWFGFPSLIDGLPPFYVIFILTTGLAVIFFTTKFAILGNIILDNFILALIVVLLSVTVTRGFLNIFPFGLTWNLMVTWLVISSILALVLRLLFWLWE